MSRLVRGGVPVMPGVTLGMLIAFTHEEGRHPRPDKRGSIAADAEDALVRLGRLFASSGPGEQAVGETRAHEPDEPPAIAAARRLAAAMRDRITTLLARARGRAGGEGTAAGPLPVRHRGTVVGSEESMRREALRRGGTYVHAARATLRE
ncbi:MAG: hypothetical protein JNL80_15185 [Phycisphaerae bacterium]|nr:hypothetical protein [Phycisphaerae bacterium]